MYECTYVQPHRCARMNGSVASTMRKQWKLYTLLLHHKTSGTNRQIMSFKLHPDKRIRKYEIHILTDGYTDTHTHADSLFMVVGRFSFFLYTFVDMHIPIIRNCMCT